VVKEFRDGLFWESAKVLDKLNFDATDSILTYQDGSAQLVPPLFSQLFHPSLNSWRSVWRIWRPWAFGWGLFPLPRACWAPRIAPEIGASSESAPLYYHYKKKNSIPTCTNILLSWIVHIELENVHIAENNNEHGEGCFLKSNKKANRHGKDNDNSKKI